MPNRIIKESVCLSDDINKLTPEEEIFFYRLITQVDDYGRLDARPQVLRAKCFPLRVDIVSVQMVQVWLKNLVAAELVKLYDVDGKIYLQLTTWERHQRIRAKVSKYPDPDGNYLVDVDKCDELTADCGNSLTDDSNSPPNAPVIHNRESIIENPEIESRKEKDIFILPDWINKNTWNDFIEMRKKQKKPPTERAIKELVNDLEKLRSSGQDIEVVISESIKHGWISFYPVSGDIGKGDGKAPPNKSSPPDDPRKYHKPDDYYGRHVQH